MDCETIKDLIFPIISTSFLVYIAYQQMKTNKEKLKNDLYDKRFDIFIVALKFYQEVIYEEMLSPQTESDFILSKNSARFLFSKDPAIGEMMEEMHKKSFPVRNFKKNSQKLSKLDSEQFKDVFDKNEKARKWFDSQIQLIKEKMHKFLAQ